MKRTAKPARRRVSYASASTPATVAKQALIRELLSQAQDGFTVAEIGAALGISRQLALYHLKKMAASYQVTLILEPCIGNGQLQFRCWDEMQVAARYARQVLQLRRAA
jgi:predicted ArsR family transcriptional regulator